ncbi:hypothetical protein EDC02_5444 [Micromonospora sp. Llam0]|uniref:hypothetical protein n=1 Tax=Micromonospora sp. Llam0 TaxID=2485143 RepID=UPI000F48B1C1|nr:hypothetical protein [Micromonospora sp. Llam0]ROO63417.1 hypothetical protein EDC02_5444 [Micromonospora sp. Llam0]
MDATAQLIAAELTRCADQLAGTARQLTGLRDDADRGLGGYADGGLSGGADGGPQATSAGRLGALTAALGRQWRDALAQRAAEADDTGRRLADTAAGLRSVVGAYRDVDVTARRRQSTEGS